MGSGPTALDRDDMRVIGTTRINFDQHLRASLACSRTAAMQRDDAIVL